MRKDRTRTLWKYFLRPSGFLRSVCPKKPPTRRCAVWDGRCRYPSHGRDRHGDNREKGGALEASHPTGSPMAARTSTQSGSTRSGRSGAAGASLPLFCSSGRSCLFSLELWSRSMREWGRQLLCLCSRFPLGDPIPGLNHSFPWPAFRLNVLPTSCCSLRWKAQAGAVTPGCGWKSQAQYQ